MNTNRWFFTNRRLFTKLGVLIFAAVAATLVSCGGGGGGGGSAPPAFSQADLTGTWDFVEARTGYAAGEWDVSTDTIDASGNDNLIQYLNNYGEFYLPPSPPLNNQIRVQIDGAGNLSVFDTSVSPPVQALSFHGVMASSKNVFVYTMTDDESMIPPTRQMGVARKRVPTVTYGNADIRGKSFAYHGLYLGTANVWEYGYGSVNLSGQLTITSKVSVFGPVAPPGPNFAAVSVDADGFVWGDANFGFLGAFTPDKSTIVGISDTIASLPGPSPMFVVMTLIDPAKTFSLADLAGTSRFHSLWNSPPGWAYGTVVMGSAGSGTVSGTEPAGSWPSTPLTFSISPNGTVGWTGDPTFHGTLSPNGATMVGTGSDSFGHGEFSLQILVR